MGFDVAEFLKHFNADCSTIEGECAAITSGLGEFRTQLNAAEQISHHVNAMARILLNAWLDCWDGARQVDRVLSLVLYDAELAMDRAYFVSQVNPNDIVQTLFAAGQLPDGAQVRLAIQWDVASGYGSETLRIQQALDRLNVIAVVTLVDAGSLTVLLPFFFSTVSQQAQISPSYVPVVCDGSTMPSWARSRVLKALGDALKDRTKFPYKVNLNSSGVPRNPFDGADLAFFGTLLHDNVSFFVQGVRHRPVPPLPGHNGTASYALALLRNPILQKINESMQQAQAAGTGNWNYLYLELAGGPDFNPGQNSVDAIVSFRYVHQGGTHPFEYELEIHGRVYLRVRLEMTPGLLWFRPSRSRENDIDDIFASWRETGVRIGLDQVADWTGFRDQMKSFALPLSDMSFQVGYTAHAEVRVLQDRVALVFVV